MEVDGISSKSLFCNRSDLVFANPGSYGAVPKEILKARISALEEAEVEPDLWYRYTLHYRYKESADLIADTFNSPRNQLALVENVSNGIASVLNSLELGQSDVILITSETYATVVMQCQEQARRYDVQLRTLNIKFPFTHESILEQYEEEIDKMEGNGRKIAIIDHITSAAALLMPLEAIIRLCKDHGVLSLVDGAHGPGQLENEQINLQRLQPDFYVATLYKWAFVPRPCAFLYVAESYLEQIRPVVVSWLHKASFRQRFTYRGTWDSSCVASIPAALKFTARLGGVKAIQNHANSLLQQGIDLLIERLGIEPLVSEEFSAPMMRTFYMGPLFDEKPELYKPLLEVHLPRLHQFLRSNANIVCPIVTIRNGRPAMRMCAHVFTDMEDIHKLVDGLEKAANKFRNMTVEDMEAVPTVDWTKEDNCE